MGQKVHPTGIRLGIVEDWRSTWYAEGQDFADALNADISVRKYLNKKLVNAAVSRIDIKRPSKTIANITIYAARPGTIIGKSGKDVELLKAECSRIMGIPAHITIQEVRKPELDATLVAQSIAQQLERRVMFRRAMKRAVTNATRLGALGIKVRVSGRLGGAEIARNEWYREGRVPLHTFRANIDYGTARAKTTYGIIGVKVWIYKGDEDGVVNNASTNATAPKSDKADKPEAKAKPKTAKKPAAKKATKTKAATTTDTKSVETTTQEGKASE